MQGGTQTHASHNLGEHPNPTNIQIYIDTPFYI